MQAPLLRVGDPVRLTPACRHPLCRPGEAGRILIVLPPREPGAQPMYLAEVGGPERGAYATLQAEEVEPAPA